MALDVQDAYWCLLIGYNPPVFPPRERPVAVLRTLSSHFVAGHYCVTLIEMGQYVGHLAMCLCAGVCHCCVLFVNGNDVVSMFYRIYVLAVSAGTVLSGSHMSRYHRCVSVL